MKKKKNHQKKIKKQGISLHRLVKITSRSLGKAYQGFKNKQKINKLKKIKLKKREEARGITKEKKELKLREDQINKEQEELKIKEKELKLKNDELRLRVEEQILKDEEQKRKDEEEQRLKDEELR